MATFLSWNRAALKRRKPVLALSGTTVRAGTAVPLEGETLKPGQTAMVQFHLKQPVAMLPGDRFILQGFELNPQHGATTGGGIVIRTHPPRKRRPDPEYAAFLRQLADAAPDQRVALEVRARGFGGAAERQLAESVPYLPNENRKALEPLLTRKKAVLFEKERRAVVHVDALADLMQRIMAELKTLSENSPMASGFPKQELYSKLPSSVPLRLFKLATERLAADKQLNADQENVALPASEHAGKQQEMAENAVKIYIRARLEPPKLADVARKLDVAEKDLKDVVNRLVRDGELVRARDNLWFHVKHIEGLKRRLVRFLEKNTEITPLQFKEMCGTSRKYFIPLAELFDEQRVTIRTGDVRRLRKP
jgi:selenocysteine-specific elongation factor